MKRSSRIAGIFVLATILAIFALATPPAANAASVSVSGTVACRNGLPVVGVWVNSTGGGSKFAGWTRRSGMPWVADYSTTLSSASSTTIRLDIGCGDAGGGRWLSNNRTGDYGGSGSRVINALCNEPSGSASPAVRCSLWNNTVLIGMPASGYYDRFGYSPFSSHPGDDVATDIYQTDGTAAVLRAAAPTSANLTMKIGSRYGSCSGAAGTGLTVNVYRNGTYIGFYRVTHLNNVSLTAGAAVYNGTVLGTFHKWDLHNSCYDVSTPEGVHVHVGLFNAEGLHQGWACYSPSLSSRTWYTEGRWIGSLGPNGISTGHQPCP
ncbi:hypothetical protein [Nocardioides aquiterrae]